MLLKNIFLPFFSLSSHVHIRNSHKRIKINWIFLFFLKQTLESLVFSFHFSVHHVVLAWCFSVSPSELCPLSFSLFFFLIRHSNLNLSLSHFLSLSLVLSLSISFSLSLSFSFSLSRSLSFLLCLASSLIYTGYKTGIF